LLFAVFNNLFWIGLANGIGLVFGDEGMVCIKDAVLNMVAKIFQE